MSTTSEAANSDDGISFRAICEKAKTDRFTMILTMIMRYGIPFEKASAIIDLASLSDGNEEWFKGVAHSVGFCVRFPSIE